MIEWTDEEDKVINEFTVKIKRQLAKRPTRIVSAYVGDELIRCEHVSDSVWVGHCWGQLWIPDFLERARKGKI